MKNITPNRIWIALQTLLYKEINRFLRIWTQTLLPSAITVALYFIIFGKLIGSQIKDIHGFSYMQYLVPGLTMMSIMNNAYSNTSSSFFITKFNHSIEEMMVSSMPAYIILIGYTIGGALRGLMVGLIIIFISLFFTHLHIQNWFVVISMASLSALVFSMGGLINAIYAKKFDDVFFIPTFILTPLTYLGGIFFSLSQLPPLFRDISIINPIFNIVDAFKYGFLGISDLSIYYGFSLIFALFVILALWSWWLLQKGIGLRS
jgi:ABC-2 type transport system permease protein